MITAIIKLLLAIPGLARLGVALEKAYNEYQTTKRLADKDAAVDSAIDRLLTPTSGQQQTPDATPTIPPSSEGSAGLHPRSVEDDKPAGKGD